MRRRRRDKAGTRRSRGVQANEELHINARFALNAASPTMHQPIHARLQV